MKIKTHKDEIEKVLREHPDTRDDDMKLLSIIWNDHNDSDTAVGLLHAVWFGNLPHPESIFRCRRTLQKGDPTLRGSRWNERHGKQDDVKEELGYPVKS